MPRPGVSATIMVGSEPRERVTVERTWVWPFPYAECRTWRGHLIPVPVSRLSF